MTTLAIDIGGTKIAAAVCDENDSIIQRWRVPTPMDADAINQHIAEVYREAVAAGHTDIEAIGISAAGNVSADRKTLTFSANIPAWINYDLSEHVGALIDHAVPVVVENDANCAGWGEYVHGAGQGSSNMVALTVGTGLGGAIVINGQLYRGSFGMAAELGHLPMVPDGDHCGCGLRGCAEHTCGEQIARLRRASRAPCLCLYPASHARGCFRVRAHAGLLFSRAGRKPTSCSLQPGGNPPGKSPRQTSMNT